MRKTPKVRAQTLESKLPQFCLQVGLNRIHISDLEVGIKRQSCPCTKIKIPLKSCKDCMLVSVPVSVVPVPKLHWFSNITWVPVPKLHCNLTACGYRYQCLHNCTTSLHHCQRPLDSAWNRRHDLQLSFRNQTHYENFHETLNNQHTHKNSRKGQKHLFYTK